MVTDFIGVKDDSPFITIVSQKYFPEGKKFTRNEFFDGIKKVFRPIDQKKTTRRNFW